MMKKLLFCITFLVILSSFEKQKIKWVAIGDSITALNEQLEKTENRVTKGFMTRVVEKLPHISYVNKGYGGWTSKILANKINEIGLESADVYTVFLGTNDWWQALPLGTKLDYENATGSNTVYGAFKIIIDKLRSLNPSAKIIMITPMKRSDFVYMADYKNNAWGSYKDKKGQTLEQFRNVIVDIAGFENLGLVDLYAEKKFTESRMVKFKLLKDPKTGELKKYFYPEYTTIPFDPAKDIYPYPVEAIDMTYDGLHPSDAGNEIIAKKLIKILRKM